MIVQLYADQTLKEMADEFMMLMKGGLFRCGALANRLWNIVSGPNGFRENVMMRNDQSTARALMHLVKQDILLHRNPIDGMPLYDWELKALDKMSGGKTRTIPTDCAPQHC